MEEVRGGVVRGDDRLLALEGEEAAALLLTLPLALVHHQLRAQRGAEAKVHQGLLRAGRDQLKVVVAANGVVLVVSEGVGEGARDDGAEVGEVLGCGEGRSAGGGATATLPGSHRGLLLGWVQSVEKSTKARET